MPLPERLIPNLYDLTVDFVGNLKIMGLSQPLLRSVA
jgi:hypothetical protein